MTPVTAKVNVTKETIPYYMEGTLKTEKGKCFHIRPITSPDREVMIDFLTTQASPYFRWLPEQASRLS